MAVCEVTDDKHLTWFFGGLIHKHLSEILVYPIAQSSVKSITIIAQSKDNGVYAFQCELLQKSNGGSFFVCLYL